MLAELFLENRSGLLVLAALLYMLVLRRIDRKETRTRPLSDEEFLIKFARMNNTSEFELFRRAGEDWHVGADAAGSDFNHYVKTGDLPHYVMDFIRKKRKEIGEPLRPPHFLGGGSLPWLK